MTFQFPLRVRCIEDTALCRRGETYVALRMLGGTFIELSPRWICPASHFKPVVRVKAKCVASLGLLLL